MSSPALDAEVDRWFAAHLQGKSSAAFAMRPRRRGSRCGSTCGVLPELEQLYLKDLMKTEDAAEGIAAFLGKRAPKWTDR